MLAKYARLFFGGVAAAPPINPSNNIRWQTQNFWLDAFQEGLCQIKSCQRFCVLNLPVMSKMEGSGNRDFLNIEKLVIIPWQRRWIQIRCQIDMNELVQALNQSAQAAQLAGISFEKLEKL